MSIDLSCFSKQSAIHSSYKNCGLNICAVKNLPHAWVRVKLISGVGKTHKDAASVRATHPIPAACGIYYFEVRIVSKGRDG